MHDRPNLIWISHIFESLFCSLLFELLMAFWFLAYEDLHICRIWCKDNSSKWPSCSALFCFECSVMSWKLSWSDIGYQKTLLGKLISCYCVFWRACHSWIVWVMRFYRYPLCSRTIFSNFISNFSTSGRQQTVLGSVDKYLDNSFVRWKWGVQIEGKVISSVSWFYVHRCHKLIAGFPNLNIQK